MSWPPYFDGMPAEADPGRRHQGARVLTLLVDSVTTDHISPRAQSKKALGRAVSGGQRRPAADFSSLGSRRGNHG